jgi:hypothetical protein
MDSENLAGISAKERNEIAAVLFDWYCCYITAGFSEEQSLALCIGIMTEPGGAL